VLVQAKEYTRNNACPCPPTQGTYYFKDGIFTGTTAITGGTGAYIGARGEETISMDSTKEPSVGTGTMQIRY
jgi:hypothetical protein